MAPGGPRENASVVAARSLRDCPQMGISQDHLVRMVGSQRPEL